MIRMYGGEGRRGERIYERCFAGKAKLDFFYFFFRRMCNKFIVRRINFKSSFLFSKKEMFVVKKKVRFYLMKITYIFLSLIY